MGLITSTDILTFYQKQSDQTNPGEFAELFEGLPKDVPAICAIIQGLILHYQEGKLSKYAIPKERFSDLDTRDVKNILKRLITLDNNPLTMARPPGKRFIGCCRDFCVLLTAILRYQGIPARICYGFSTYFKNANPPNSDHLICLYWHANEQRWVQVDPQQDDLHRKMNKLTFDPYDIPDGRFIRGGQAWQVCRTSEIIANDFGYGPRKRGLWVARTVLVHELAAFNRVETLVQDFWGLGLAPENTLTNNDYTLLDKVSSLLLEGPSAFEELQNIYLNTPELKVSENVTIYDLRTGKMRMTKLQMDSA